MRDLRGMKDSVPKIRTSRRESGGCPSISIAASHAGATSVAMRQVLPTYGVATFLRRNGGAGGSGAE